MPDSSTLHYRGKDPTLQAKPSRPSERFFILAVPGRPNNGQRGRTAKKFGILLPAPSPPFSSSVEEKPLVNPFKSAYNERRGKDRETRRASVSREQPSGARLRRALRFHHGSQPATSRAGAPDTAQKKGRHFALIWVAPRSTLLSVPETGRS